MGNEKVAPDGGKEEEVKLPSGDQKDVSGILLG